MRRSGLTFAWLGLFGWLFGLVAVEARAQRKGAVVLAGSQTEAGAKEAVSKNVSTIFDVEGGYTGTEVVQQELSGYLDKQADLQRTRLKERLKQVIEDMGRVLNLDGPSLEKLNLVALGAAERSLDKQRASMESRARSQTKTATPQTIQEILKSIGTYSLDVSRVEAESIWKAGLAASLDDQQRLAWEKAQSDRDEYRRKAITEMLLVGLDGAVGLTEDQLMKLRPLAETAIHDYLPDLSRFYSDARIDFRMVLLFVSGMPGKEVKAILSGDQYKKWEAATSEYSGWWEGIQRNHESRMKSKSHPQGTDE